MPPEPAHPITAIAELRAWPHWVVWRQEIRNSKSTKVPYMPAAPRRRASSTEAGTWGSHADAVRAAAASAADGIGYVFSPTDEYTGVDLDKCVVDGKVVAPAMDIVRRLSSYTELSPTGTGLHIYVRGRIKGDRKRTGKSPWGGEFESYDQGRFFTVTEQHLSGTPTTIEPRQDELDAVRAEILPESTRSLTVVRGNGLDDDEELLRRARAAKNGRDFDLLWAGDTSRNGDDESAADLALCNMLAFWAGPYPDRLDRLFRRSGLMRPKWDEQRGEKTYGQITVEKALNGRTEFFNISVADLRPAPLLRRYADDESGGHEMRAELARLLLGKEDKRRIVQPRASGRDSKAVVDVPFNDGSVLRLDPVSAFTAPTKLTNEIAFQLGAEVSLKEKDVRRILTLLRALCEFRETFTLEQRAMDFGISFLQETTEKPADVANGGLGRWEGFEHLNFDPTLIAKAEAKSFAAACIVLRDTTTGDRYVRISWFSTYVRAIAAPGVATDVVDRMRALGWVKPGNEGRVKATQPGTGNTLQWAFYVVPEGWEQA